MIEEISKIVGVGNYNHNKPVRLSKYNLFYGMNGSGKTTLSRLLSYIDNNNQENLEVIRNISFDKVDFQVKPESDSLLNKILVFNQDFVKENIFTESGIKGFMLGKDNKEYEDLKNKLEKAVTNFIKDYNRELYDNYKKIHEELKTIRDYSRIFTTIAFNIRNKLISEGFTDYNNSTKLNSQHIEKCLKSLETHEYNYSLSFLQNPNAKEQINDTFFQNLSSLNIDLNIDYIKQLLKNTINRNELEDIKNISNEIRAWVKDGIKHHENHTEQCFFCNSSLDLQNRLQELNSYFNEFDVVKAKEQIEEIKNKIEAIKNKIENHVFHNVVNEIINKQKNIEVKNSVIKELNKLIIKIKTKLIDSNLGLEISIIEIEDSLINSIAKYNEFILNIRNHYTEYNSALQENIDSFENKEKEYVNNLVLNELSNPNGIYKEQKTQEEQKESAVDLAKCSYIESIKLFIDKINNFITNSHSIEDLHLDTINVQDDGLLDIENVFSIINKIKEDNTKQILSKINSYESAIELINKNLELFGRDFKIEFKEENKIFIINRGKNSNKLNNETLSEGEKNILAFIYFISNIESKDNIGKKILVIDDPVSSLDYNNIFSIYDSLINIPNKKYNQFIFLTHNFYFARYLDKHFESSKKPETKEKEAVYKVFTITQNKIQTIGENDYIFNNEFEFLLKEIAKLYDGDNENNNIHLYNLGNMCRRLIELFCETKFTKIDHYINENLKDKKFNNENLNIRAFNRFLHFHSHGHSSNSEMQTLPIKNFIIYTFYLVGLHTIVNRNNIINNNEILDNINYIT